MKNVLFVRHAVLALGLLIVGQVYATITLSFFGHTLGKKVNAKLQNIDKECAVLSDLLLAADQVFAKNGVVDLFAVMDISKNKSRKTAATKIKKEFDVALKNISIEALNNATEQERMEFVSSFAVGVNSVFELHNIIAPICQATLDQREQIVTDKQLLQHAQDFFIYVVKPIEDTMNLLVDLAQNEHAMKLISEVVPNLAGIKDEIAVSLAAYNSLNIRQKWTLWDIAKWTAAGAATAGVAYYVYKNSDNLSERMNNLITSAKTYRPTWSGFKTSLSTAASGFKASLSSAAARVGGVYSSAKMKLFGEPKSSQQEKRDNSTAFGSKAIVTKEDVRFVPRAEPSPEQDLQIKIDEKKKEIDVRRKEIRSAKTSADRKEKQLKNKKASIELDMLQRKQQRILQATQK